MHFTISRTLMNYADEFLSSPIPESSATDLTPEPPNTSTDHEQTCLNALQHWSVITSIILETADTMNMNSEAISTFLNCITYYGFTNTFCIKCEIFFCWKGFQPLSWKDFDSLFLMDDVNKSLLIDVIEYIFDVIINERCCSMK